MVEHSGETWGEYELFHGSGKGGEKGGRSRSLLSKLSRNHVFLTRPSSGTVFALQREKRLVIRRVSRDELIYRHKFIPLPRLV